jgi:Tol biopolymer transport system component
VAIAAEWKTRRVFRAVIGYGVVVFAILQIIEPIMHGLHLPDATLTWTLIAVGAAFPMIVIVALVTDRGGATTHAHPGWIAGASAAVLLAALAVFLATRRREARLPTLSQITFEGGIEEYAAWSPDGKQIAYVAQSGRARKLFRRDLAAGSAIQLTKGDMDDLHPSWSPDGTRVVFMRAQRSEKKLQPGDVFGQFTGADVWELDLRTGKESLLVADAFEPAFGPHGEIAVAASWAGPRRIWLLDERGQNPQQVTTDTTEEVAHSAPRFSPDGRAIVFQTQQRTKFDVRIVDLATKKQTAITDDFPVDVQPAWSPSGRFVYFTSDRGGGYNIWRAPVDENGALSGALHQITTGAGQDVEPAPSPDGRNLAYSTLRQNADIWKLPVDPQTGAATGDPEAVIATTREESRGAWSPDGARIAFNSDRSGEMNIWIRTLATGAERRVTTGAGGDFQPNWSPDGSRLAFFSSRSGRPRIFTVDLASSLVSPLTAGTAVEVNPFFSPDGQWIAFQSERSGRSEVWAIPSRGGEERQLTRDGVIGHFMRWTDDSAFVLYSCRCGGKRALQKAPLAGGDPVVVADIGNVGSHISLSPDRKRLMDVVGHRTLEVFDLASGAGAKVYEFADPTVRIDYPVWSPDGRSVLFERNRPEGGDIWVVRDVE